MNITNFGNIPNITSQITTGAPQASFRCDPASIQRMQDRVQQGNYIMKPTDAELSAYIDTLRQNGLDGSVDWSGLTSELDSFKATTSEELEVTLLGLQFKNLTNQEPRTSTYQKSVNSWQDFLTSIGGGVDVRA